MALWYLFAHKGMKKKVRASSRNDTSSTDEHNLIPAKVPRQQLRSGKMRAFAGVSEK